MTLQEICRAAIRKILRFNINLEYPHLKQERRRQPKKKQKKRRVQKIVIPIFEGAEVFHGENGSSEEDRREMSDSHRRNTDQWSNMIGEALIRGSQVNNRQRKSVEWLDWSSSVAVGEATHCTKDTGSSQQSDMSGEIESSSDEASTRNGIEKKLNDKKDYLSVTGVNKLSEDDSESQSNFDDTDMEVDQDVERPAKRHHNGRSERSANEPRRPSSSASSSDADGDAVQRQNTRITRTPTAIIWRRITYGEPDSDSEREENPSDKDKSDFDDEVEPKDNWLSLMRKKISHLPLPPSLKSFVNYFRDL